MEYESLRPWDYRITKAFSLRTNIRPTNTIRTNFSTLTTTGRLYIHKGFCWDGASGARDTGNIMRGSCIHDAFCNWHQKGLITLDQRKQADDLFYNLIKKDGIGIMRAWYIIKAVKAHTKIRYGI